MTKQEKLFKQAAKESLQSPRYVVHVPDEGTQIMDAESYKIWHALVFLEATFIGGVQVSTNK